MRSLRRLKSAGSAGASPAWLAVIVALLVIASETPTTPRDADGLGKSHGGGALESRLREEASELQKLAYQAWGNARAFDAAPEVRAREAAEALQQSLAGRFPSRGAGASMDLALPRITVEEGPEGSVPGELCIRLVGTLSAVDDEGAARSLALDVRARDPELPRARRFAADLLEEQSRDPRSAAAAELAAVVRAALRKTPTPSQTDLEAAVDAALARAAVTVERQILGTSLSSGPSKFGWAPTPLESASSPPPDLALVLANFPADDFAAYLRAFLLSRLPDPAAAALLAVLPAANASLLGAARRLVESDASPFAALFVGAAASVRATALAGATLLFGACRALGASIALEAARATDWMGALSPAPLTEADPAPASLVHFRGVGARLTFSGARSAAWTSAGGVRPFEATAVLSLSLESVLLTPAGGSWIESSSTRAMSVVIPLALAAPWPDLPWAPRADATPAFAVASEGLRPLAWALDLLEHLRRETDSRLLRFKDAVTNHLAESSASGVARLALRVLDRLAENESAGAGRALFDLLDRFIADDLRDALTVNFSFLGLALSLVPDPVRQQVTLEHQQGPHTFGVRLRRVTADDNPLAGKFEDHGSLALELFWIFEQAPVHAALTVDPFLRTDDGLLRFDLRVTAGEGVGISVVAPHIVRRLAVFEVALSSVLPGGIPLGPTPTGGLAFFDAGVRIELARVAVPTLLRSLLRACERALFDVLENQTVREVADQLGVGPLARRFVGRLVARLADTFAEEASHFVLKVVFFARVRAAEAAGLLGATAEVGLEVKEPVLVFREAAADAASRARLAALAAAAPRADAPSPLDDLPVALQDRIGVEARLEGDVGPKAFPLVARLASVLPGASVEQSVFLSVGAMASQAGRRGVHALSEFALGWDGLAGARLPPLPFRLAAQDALEAVHLTVESLVGPRILISEVLPAPAGSDSDLEFIELYNPGWAEEVLTGWSIEDAGGHAFRLPDGTRIAPGRTLLVARSALPLFRHFGAVPDVSTLTLSLNDGGDRVVLLNARGMPSDEVAWGPGAPAPRVPPEETSLARAHAASPPIELPGSSLKFTGSPLDFEFARPTPGWAP